MKMKKIGRKGDVHSKFYYVDPPLLAHRAKVTTMAIEEKVWNPKK